MTDPASDTSMRDTYPRNATYPEHYTQPDFVKDSTYAVVSSYLFKMYAIRSSRIISYRIHEIAIRTPYA